MFEDYTWQIVEDSAYRSLAEQHFLNDGRACAMRITPLSFFEDAFLLEIRNQSSIDDTVFYLVDNDLFLYLDGTIDPIFVMKDQTPICLDVKNVLEYVEFFCSFVQGDEGPFFIVRDMDHPAFDHSKFDDELYADLPTHILPPKLTAFFEIGTFQTFATILYGTTLFNATFNVYSDGRIDMTDDTPLYRGIPVKKITLGCNKDEEGGNIRE